MDAGTIISGITSAVSLAKTLKDMGGDSETKALSTELYDSIINLQSGLLTLQGSYFQLQQEKNDILKELDSVKQWEQEKEKYELKELQKGRLLYSLKDGITGEPHHYICTNCFQDGRKSILHLEDCGHTHFYKCFSCDTEYEFPTGKNPTVGFNRSY